MDLKARRDERAKQLEKAMGQAAKATALVQQLQGALWELDQQLAVDTPATHIPSTTTGMQGNGSALASVTEDE